MTLATVRERVENSRTSPDCCWCAGGGGGGGSVEVDWAASVEVGEGIGEG
jgi:hypothetical protein